MALLSELLQRLRRPGVPGPARAAAVPADPAAAMEEELQPVLRLMEPVALRGREILEEAAGEAAQIRARASVDAEAIVGAARADAARVRSEAASSRLAEAERARQVLLDEAVNEAARIDRLVTGRLDDVADRLVERALKPAQRP